MSAPAPRGRVSRTAIAVLLWFATLVVAPVVIGTVVMLPLLLALLALGEDEAYSALLDVAAFVSGLAVQLGFFAWLAPKVSYRWFDCLILLVPFSGALIWGSRIAWRVAYLPYRDWRPRPDEAPFWERVLPPSGPGRPPIRIARTARQAVLTTQPE